MVKPQRGVAAVEFAILIVPLLLMLFGVTEYGRAIYQYNTLSKSVRDATRYLTTVSPGNGHTEAKNIVVCGHINCGGISALAPNLNQGMVKICDATTIADCPGVPHSAVPTGISSVNLVTVKIVDYEFKTLMNFSIGGVTIGAPNITFDSIYNTMRQPL